MDFIHVLGWWVRIILVDGCAAGSGEPGVGGVRRAARDGLGFMRDANVMPCHGPSI